MSETSLFWLVKTNARVPAREDAFEYKRWQFEMSKQILSLIYLYKMQELSKGIRLSFLDIFSLKTYQDANG